MIIAVEGNEKMAKYIDADRLKRHYAWWETGTKEMTLHEAKYIFNDIVDVQKAADVVEVRHGRWYDRGSLSCRCSECGCKANKETAYCPNCGARMVAEDE